MESLGERGTCNVKQPKIATLIYMRFKPRWQAVAADEFRVYPRGQTQAYDALVASNRIYRGLACTSATKGLIQGVATVRGLELVYGFIS